MLRGNAGLLSSDFWQAIKCPGGRIITFGGPDFESLEKWIEHLRQEPKKRERGRRMNEEKPWGWPIAPNRSDQVTIRIDLWAEQQAEKEADRRKRRELDPFRLGHWNSE